MQSVHQLACQVLNASCPTDKINAAHTLSKRWHDGVLEIDTKPNHFPPEHPGKPRLPKLVSPQQLKRRRLGSLHGRTSLLHAIAHIEFNAVNLAADMVARFVCDPRIASTDKQTFASDWIDVCDDEARHFTLVQNRLHDMDSSYGDFPAHDGLWQAAHATQFDIAARIAIAPMVLEARGLDVTPNMIEKLEKALDSKSANILKIIYEEEIGHVAKGVKWFFYICERENRNKEDYFKELISTYFRGHLKPPFNVKARESAGFPLSFYQSS